ncbi:hypothetical protein RO21_08625 [[Actinobacillus] muris]|uniref:Peptidase M1 membrane alanine aminopeptidase domain-containing protein n=1 Tax=Muribacter muris TaxID=67855 RepID=A0A0J5S2K4_9PAST|nr:hypothetical protein [Muribacter muris]KMK51027.1 hypothetical protein RO21_08625 [[Actinobacillus] muris] [Muribacter muris]
MIDFAENGEKFYYKGDALDDFLSYNILNTSKLNEEEYYRIYEFIAHEIFHLWNSYEHKHTGKSWLHEGSATYFAIRTLADLGYISKHKLLKLQSGYLDACYDYYKNKSNKPMNNNTSDYSYYICGNSLHILLERFENKHTVFKIWQALFKQGNYHSDDFIKQLKADKSIKNKTKSNLNDFSTQRCYPCDR